MLRPLLDLHSFPTRRSSDLAPAVRTFDKAGTIIDRAAEELRLDEARLSVGGRHLQPRSLDADRKSTRLNSSHLVISYAVFCLKKNRVFGLDFDTSIISSLSG